MLSKKQVLLILLFVGFYTISGQDYFVGRVIDSKSKQPVVFAHILVKGSEKGVISNEDGGFRIPIGYMNYNNELLISSMGYETITVSFDTFYKGEVSIYYLRPKINQLQETTVIGYKSTSSARKIVRRAIRNIPENFPKNQFALVGYYRDYQKQESEYINLNEAIVEIQDEGFGKNDLKTTDYRIYRFLENHDFPQDSISSSVYDYENLSKTIDRGYLRPYNGNELLILRVHDAIRNYDYGAYSFIGKMRRDLLSNHRFSIGNDIFFDGEWLYSINFETSKANTIAKGTLLISKKNYSIYKLDYSVFDEIKGQVLGKHKSDLKNNNLIFEVHSEYRPHKGKMYLNYLSFSNSFTARIPPVFIVKNIVVDLVNKELLVYLNALYNLELAKNPSHYELYYSGDRIPVSVSLNRNKDKIVKLSPIFKSKKDENLFYENLQKESRENDTIPIQLKILGLKDIYGNVINQYRKEKYFQFREFFTQKTFPFPNFSEKKGFYMDKTKPLNQNTPDIMIKQEYGDYWMNTPLRE